MLPILPSLREPIRALNRVRIEENGEPLVDLRSVCPSLTVREGISPYARARVAEMLEEAAARLPDRVRLHVRRALRTVEEQRKIWDDYVAKLAAAHPSWPRCILVREANRYCAPYDQPAPPGHCTGGAVDVLLIGDDGKPLDVVPPLPDWSFGHTWSRKVSPGAQANRQLLHRTMLLVGFSNYAREYWHYSYGDSAWALRTARGTCFYGLAPPYEDVEDLARPG